MDAEASNDQLRGSAHEVMPQDQTNCNSSITREQVIVANQGKTRFDGFAFVHHDNLVGIG
jgi:hypothetical protein